MRSSYRRGYNPSYQQRYCVERNFTLYFARNKVFSILDFLEIFTQLEELLVNSKNAEVPQNEKFAIKINIEIKYRNNKNESYL